jgi:hypothetical protein
MENKQICKCHSRIKFEDGMKMITGMKKTDVLFTAVRTLNPTQYKDIGDMSLKLNIHMVNNVMVM